MGVRWATQCVVHTHKTHRPFHRVNKLSSPLSTIKLFSTSIVLAGDCLRRRFADSRGESVQTGLNFFSKSYVTLLEHVIRWHVEGASSLDSKLSILNFGTVRCSSAQTLSGAHWKSWISVLGFQTIIRTSKVLNLFFLIKKVFSVLNHSTSFASKDRVPALGGPTTPAGRFG